MVQGSGDTLGGWQAGAAANVRCPGDPADWGCSGCWLSWPGLQGAWDALVGQLAWAAAVAGQGGLGWGTLGVPCEAGCLALPLMQGKVARGPLWRPCRVAGALSSQRRNVNNGVGQLLRSK